MSTETEQIGAGILRDLQLQREQIERTRNQVSEADQHLSRADQILNAMARRCGTPFELIFVRSSYSVVLESRPTKLSSGLLLR